MFFGLIIFLLSSLLTYLAISSLLVSGKFSSLNDIPNERKIHLVTIPKYGGISIVFALTMSTSLILYNTIYDIDIINIFLPLIFSTGIIFIGGLMDDFVDVSPMIKLTIQFIASCILVLNGLQFELNGLFSFLDKWLFFNEMLSIFLLILFANAFNLIDGVDGLAGSITFVISITIFYLYIHFTIADIYIYSILALAGSLFIFIYYNWAPAKIFLGDSGSQLIGWILATNLLTFQLDYNISSIDNLILFPLIILSIPVFDVFSVIIKRLHLSSYSIKSIVKADRIHIHHIILNVCKSKYLCVVYLAGLQIIISLIGIFCLLNNCLLTGSIIVFLLNLILRIGFDLKNQN